MNVQKITPFLWFDANAEEAINYYVSVFRDSQILSMTRYPDESIDEHFVGMSGKLINAEFVLAGMRFSALDGGPVFKFNEAISMLVMCDDQAEVDYYWEKLSHVPESEQCGWCKDRFGLSWQIVPKQLNELMGGNDPERSRRVTKAFMKMHKISVADLRAAYDSAA